MSKNRPKHDPGLPKPAESVAAESLVPSLPNAPAVGADASRREPRLLSGFRARAWHNAKNFFAGGCDAAFLWPRWLVLRAIGLVYLLVFGGIVVEGRALLAPTGIMPLAPYFADIQKLAGGAFAAFFKAPSLFWLSGGTGMIMGVAWLGLAAAMALVLNLWPRLALFVCWLAFLSFVATWGEFSPAQLDRLMLEAAVLCIPFAPRGFRPGLGADCPPRPIALFMMRWFLLRLMLESGVVKLISADPHWRNLTAMDVLYETAPSPTVLGYWMHHLPHAFHVLEIAFTFAAELMAPAFAIFGGRRGRWIALGLWSVLQIGIQFTCNFGWLNVTALAAGLLLLDDRMLARAVDRMGLRRAARFMTEKAVRPRTGAAVAWRLHGMRVALGLHFALTLYYFAEVCGLPVESAPAVISAPAAFFREFQSANGYRLYANFEDSHYQIDYEGSNDNGRTWRTYELRHLPQRVDRRPAFIAPWFPRFDTALQIESSKPGRNSVFVLTAVHLLTRDPEVMGLFRTDPFPDRLPLVVRMRRYRLTFTDPATRRSTGRYWRKEYAGEYQPALYLDDRGGISQFDLTEADAAANAGNFARARQLYTRQYQLGNVEAGLRLSEMYTQGRGDPVRPEQIFALLSDLAGRGESRSMHSVAICYENGIGVPLDLAKAIATYKDAAAHGNLLSFVALGKLAAEDRLVPRNDVEGLAYLLAAAERATGSEPQDKFIQASQPALAKALTARMSPGDLAKAREQATSLP